MRRVLVSKHEAHQIVVGTGVDPPGSLDPVGDERDVAEQDGRIGVHRLRGDGARGVDDPSAVGLVEEVVIDNGPWPKIDRLGRPLTGGHHEAGDGLADDGRRTIVRARSRRIRAGACSVGIADPGVVTGVDGHADHRLARAGAGLAGAHPGAGVTVYTGRAVGRFRIRASARGGIADPGLVALVEDGAYDGFPTDAHTRLAGVGLSAPIAIAAGGPVRSGSVHDARRGIAGVDGAGPAVVDDGRRSWHADASAVAGLDTVARVPVIATERRPGARDAIFKGHAGT